MPAISAAYLSPPRASVVVPIFDAVFARESVASKEDLTNKPKPANPATPTKAVLRLRTEPATAVMPFVADLKPFDVLSRALITILKLLAIAITHNMEVSQPFVKVTDRHLLCFFNCNVKAISQR